jgi:hypothetical protein
MLKKQIQQICEDCASKMFLEILPDTVYSAWEDTCDVCHENKEVADIYDYTPTNEKR